MSLLRMLFLLLATLPFLAQPGAAQDVTGSADHPLIPRYAGTEIRDYAVNAFDEFLLITGPSLPAGTGAAAYEASQPLEGRVSHFLYRAPMDRSALEVFRNYETALKEAGFETLFTCSKADCGPRFNSLINPGARYNGLIYGDQQRFLAAKLVRPEGDVYVSLYATSFEPEARPFILLDVIEVAPMEARMQVIKASEMEETLARDGRIAIYGILFDFDSAEILPESKEQIDQLAAMLQDSATLQVLIVGHTDGKGAFDYNLSLSQRRAQAVADALAAQGIAADRITPAGAGMVAPVATNRTEEGRAKNRRVEIVELVRN
ncbi:OmpA family protein [Pseudogemmobacter bohemicus]|uniref:OmpA family protein n=1 Tax=Pseudogemmobacter bohemicus TaxID=2250708 RepID=UPI000DD2F59B|nr:OmpA family protein [Pseudogemmobacter bohemicus]